LLQVLVFILSAAFTLSVVKTYQHINGPAKDIRLHQQWAVRTYAFMWILVLLARMIGAVIHHTAALPHPALTDWTVYITSALTGPVVEGLVHMYSAAATAGSELRTKAYRRSSYSVKNARAVSTDTSRENAQD